MRLFSSWGIEMLVGQLYDQSRSVALTALSILDEACEDKVGTRPETVLKLTSSSINNSLEFKMLI